MSEKSLQQLIESIKSEGIAAADKASAEILAKAKQEAEDMVRLAEEKRDRILAKANEEARDIIEKGEAAFTQAGRDYGISVRNDVLKIFEAVLGKEVKRTLSEDLVKQAIMEVVKNVGKPVEVKLSPDLAKDLANYIHSQSHSDQIKDIIEDEDLLDGFVISQTEEGWSYTISAEDVASALQSHLNPHWVDILNKKND